MTLFINLITGITLLYLLNNARDQTSLRAQITFHLTLLLISRVFVRY